MHRDEFSSQTSEFCMFHRTDLDCGAGEKMRHESWFSLVGADGGSLVKSLGLVLNFT